MSLSVVKSQTSFIDIAPNSFSKTESGKQPHLRAYDKEGIVELIRQTGLIVTLPIERGTPIHVHGLDAYKVLSRCEKIVLERLPVYSHYRTTRMYETTSRHLHRVPVYHAHVKDEDPRKGTLLVVSFAPCKFAMFMGSHLDIARQVGQDSPILSFEGRVETHLLVVEFRNSISRSSPSSLHLSTTLNRTTTTRTSSGTVRLLRLGASSAVLQSTSPRPRKKREEFP